MFFRELPSKLAEQNSTKTGHMLGSECDLKVYVRNLGYTLRLQIGALKPPFFRRLRNQTVTLTDYTGGLLHLLNVMNFGTQSASNWTAILPALRNFCILLHCQASQTEISKRNSTRLWQTADSKQR